MFIYKRRTHGSNIITIVWTRMFSLYWISLVRLWNKHCFANVNHARIHSWNQQVLSDEGSFLLKETVESSAVACTHDWHASTTYKTWYPLRHYTVHSWASRIVALVYFTFYILSIQNLLGACQIVRLFHYIVIILQKHGKLQYRFIMR